MTIEEITQKIDDLSQRIYGLSKEVYDLGRTCTDEYFGQRGTHLRSVLHLAGEFMKNMSFSMDDYVEVLEEITTE